MSERMSRYWQRAEECVALAKAATSNKVRALHYANAMRFSQLADLEARLAVRSRGSSVLGLVTDTAQESPPDGVVPL